MKNSTKRLSKVKLHHFVHFGSITINSFAGSREFFLIRTSRIREDADISKNDVKKKTLKKI